MKTLLLVLAASAVFFMSSADAAEKYLKTEAGYIVLTEEDCALGDDFRGEHYQYAAYATEQGEENHLGCWKPIGEAVNVWFPEINAVASYMQFLFSDDQQ